MKNKIVCGRANLISAGTATWNLDFMRLQKKEFVLSSGENGTIFIRSI